MSTEAQDPAATARPLQDHTIPDLVHMFNEKCLAARRLGFCGMNFPLEPEEDDEDPQPLPDTFLKPPAAAVAIQALERRLRSWGFAEGLPADYISFLQVTNGIYAGGDDTAADNTEIFRPVGEITLEQDAMVECTLLPEELLGDDIEIEWPMIENAVQLGAGGDEGQQLLVPPHTTREAIRVLEQVYAAGDAVVKRKIRDAAERIYGGWENLTNLEVAVVRAYHWAAEIEAFASFKHLLESHVTGMDKECSDEDDDDTDEGEGEDDDAEDGEQDGDCDSSADEDSEPPSKRRKTLKETKPDALNGLKLLFMGTFDTMDRKTCETTAKTHGAKITTKLEDADYIVLGVRPGPKKIAAIRERGLRTIDEQAFRDLLNGARNSE